MVITLQISGLVAREVSFRPTRSASDDTACHGRRRWLGETGVRYRAGFLRVRVWWMKRMVRLDTAGD